MMLAKIIIALSILMMSLVSFSSENKSYSWGEAGIGIGSRSVSYLNLSFPIMEHQVTLGLASTGSHGGISNSSGRRNNTAGVYLLKTFYQPKKGWYHSYSFGIGASRYTAKPYEIKPRILGEAAQYPPKEEYTFGSLPFEARIGMGKHMGWSLFFRGEASKHSYAALGVAIAFGHLN